MSSKSPVPNPPLNVEQDAAAESRPERRAHPRQALDRVGRLSRDGESYCDCRVRDFCPDGMLLAVDNWSADEPVIGGVVVTVGESLILEFTALLNGEKHEHLARVRVVRISSQAIGVSFDGENAEAVWQLRQLVRELKDGLRKNRDEARSARSPCAPMAVEQALNAGQMLDVAKEQTELFLSEGLGKLFEEAEKRLVASTNNGVGDSSNVNSLEAMKEIQDVKVSIEAAYLKAVTRDFDAMINPDAVKKPEDSTGAQELALVDTGSFDDWLTIKNILVRTPPTFLQISPQSLCSCRPGGVSKRTVIRLARRGRLGVMYLRIMLISPS